MSNKNLITKLLAFILCISISAICEDVIYLKNGGKLRGEIVKTTKTGVWINVGFGEMEVDSSEIARIKRGDKAEQDEWGEEEPKAEPEVEPKEEPKVAPKLEPKVAPKLELKVAPKIVPKVAPKIVPKVAPKIVPKVAPKIVPKVEPKIEPMVEPEVKPKKEPKMEPKVEQKEEPKRRARRRLKRDQVKKQAERKYNMKQNTSFHYLSAKKGIFVIGEAKVNQDLLKASAIPKEKYSNIPESTEIGIYYPKQLSPGKKCPLFLAMGPGVDIGISEINSYVQFADKLGFIVAAPELPPNTDIEEARFYYLLHIIEYLREAGVIADKQVWIGGMSGGGQWALQLGAYGGGIFNGIISIGRIEDFTIIVDSELQNKSVLDVPICLLNKQNKNVTDSGNEQYKKTIASIKSLGFTRIKVMEYGGENIIPSKEVFEAFNWLRSNAQ